MKRRLGKGQRMVLFLFFVLTVAFTYSNIHVLSKAIERIHSKMIIYGLEGYKKLEIGNFTYHYKETDQQYVEEVVEKTQEMVGKVAGNLKQSDRKSFDVVLYSNPMEMNQGLRLPSGERTLGAYYGGNIFLLSPSQLKGEASAIENVILHEYAHLLVEDITGGKHPVWFTEGIALYQEYIITGYEWGGRDGDSLYPPFTIEQLDKQFYQLDTFMAYRSSFLRVKFLAQEYGENALLDIMDEMRKNKGYDETLEKILKKSRKQLESEFVLWWNAQDYDKL